MSSTLIDLSLGALRTQLNTTLGGRISSLIFEGQELLYLDKSLLCSKPPFGQPSCLRETNPSAIRQQKRLFGFPLWGGDKTWVAPQSAWWEDSPPIVLDHGPYQIVHHDETEVTLVSLPCFETGLEITRHIRLLENSRLILKESFRNISDAPVHRGIWNVTQFLRPGRVYIPCNQSQLIPYAHEGDSHAAKSTACRESSPPFMDWQQCEEESFVEVACLAPRHFKFGAHPRQGVIRAILTPGNQPILHERRFPVSDGPYAHAGSVEVYNAPIKNYFELEVHAPLKTLAPGDTQTLEQLWSFEPCT